MEGKTRLGPPPRNDREKPQPSSRLRFGCAFYRLVWWDQHGFDVAGLPHRTKDKGVKCLPPDGARGCLAGFFVLMVMLGCAHSADAHGIAGNRFFPGTLSFDDPAVADEAIVPNFAGPKEPGEGGDLVGNRYSSSIFRLLTKTLGVGIDSGTVHRDWAITSRQGFDTTNLTVKGEVYGNDLHETLVSAGLAWGIGHSGAQGVGANAPDLIIPGIFFGKGFGDLPDNLAWLRPFGITGAVTLEHPMTGVAVNFGVDDQTGQ